MKEFLWFLLGISPLGSFYSLKSGATTPGEKIFSGLASIGSILVPILVFTGVGIFAGLGIGAMFIAALGLMTGVALAARLLAKVLSFGELFIKYLKEGSLTTEEREQLSRDLGFVLFGYSQQEVLRNYKHLIIDSPDGEELRRSEALKLQTKYNTNTNKQPAVKSRQLKKKLEKNLKILGFTLDSRNMLQALPGDSYNGTEIIELYKPYISHKLSTPPHINPRALWSDIIVPLIILGFTTMAAFAMYGGSNWGLTGVGGLAAPGQILMTGILSAHPVSALVFAGLALAFITQWVIQKFKFSPPDDSPSKAIELSIEALKLLNKGGELKSHELDALVSYCQQLAELEDAGVIKQQKENHYPAAALHTEVNRNQQNQPEDGGTFYTVPLEDTQAVNLNLKTVDTKFLQAEQNCTILKNYLAQLRTQDSDLRNPHIRKKDKPGQEREKARKFYNAWTLVLSVSALAVATGLVYAVIGGIYVTMGALSWVLPLAALSGFISLASAKKFLASTSGGPYTELALITGAGCTVLLSLVFATLILSWPSTGLVLALGSPAVLTWLIPTLGLLLLAMSLAAVRSWFYGHATPEDRKNENKAFYYPAKGLLIVIKLGMLAGSLLLGYIGMGGLFNFDAGFLGIQGGLTQYIFGIGTALVPNNFVLVYNMLSIFSVVTVAVALVLAVLTFRSLMRDFQPENVEDYEYWKPKLDLLNLVFKLGLTISLVVALWVLLPGLGGIFATSTGLLPVMFVVAFALPLFTGNIKFLSAIDQLLSRRENPSPMPHSLLADVQVQDNQNQPNAQQVSWLVKLEKAWNKYLGVEPFYKGNDNDFITRRFYKYAIRETVVCVVLLLSPAIILISVVTPWSFVFYAAAFYLSGACMSVLFRLQRVLPEMVRKNENLQQTQSALPSNPTEINGYNYDPHARSVNLGGNRLIANMNPLLPLHQRTRNNSSNFFDENEDPSSNTVSASISAPVPVPGISSVSSALPLQPNGSHTPDSSSSSLSALEDGAARMSSAPLLVSAKNNSQQPHQADDFFSRGEVFEFDGGQSHLGVETGGVVVPEEFKTSWNPAVDENGLYPQQKDRALFGEWYDLLEQNEKLKFCTWSATLQVSDLEQVFPWLRLSNNREADIQFFQSLKGKNEFESSDSWDSDSRSEYDDSFSRNERSQFDGDQSDPENNSSQQNSSAEEESDLNVEEVEEGEKKAEDNTLPEELGTVEIPKELKESWGAAAGNNRLRPQQESEKSFMEWYDVAAGWINEIYMFAMVRYTIGSPA
jgi:hypothetical protein